MRGLRTNNMDVTETLPSDTEAKVPAQDWISSILLGDFWVVPMRIAPALDWHLLICKLIITYDEP